MSCMSPCGRACVPILEVYLAPLLSILPIREVVDGRPRDPGGGCVMSAAGEKRIDDVALRQGERPTHYDSWVCGIVEEGNILWFRGDIWLANLRADSGIDVRSGDRVFEY